MSLIFSHQACFRFCIRFCFFKLSKRDFSVWQLLEVSNAQRLSHSTNLWKDPPSKYSWSYFVLLSLAKYLPTPNLSGHFARHSFHNLPCFIFIFLFRLIVSFFLLFHCYLSYLTFTIFVFLLLVDSLVQTGFLAKISRFSSSGETEHQLSRPGLGIATAGQRFHTAYKKGIVVSRHDAFVTQSTETGDFLPLLSHVVFFVFLGALTLLNRLYMNKF